jgi:hypothetical protein
MKSRTILIFIIIFLATPLWMRIGWEVGHKKALNLLIVDKTVLNANSFKHRSVNWILDYEKYTKSSGSFYEINKDYYGFFPQENEKYDIKDFEKMNEGELDSLASVYDMAYFTDTYGIMGNEWYKHRDIFETSTSIYGGLSEKDILLLKKMKERSKPIIAEYNTIGFPTTHDVRVSFEKMFGVEWTGWVARYISSLDTINNPDLPKWIVRKYKKEHKGNWSFKNEGLLFIHENGNVIVLEKGKELVEAMPKIYTTNKYQSRFDLPAAMIYPYWIDIMMNKSDTNEVAANYLIETTREGENILKENGISRSFPCIIHREKDFPFYYFCGDFADNPTKFRFAKLDGITSLKFLMYNAVDITDRNRFFWEFYLPMMQSIFNETYKERLSKK